ncbi:MAG TPA: Hsp20/alpha crystallin family protein [Candidatus Binatia bacterium]|jgi:HSP20 family molecular chaperone IbpA
MTEQELNVREKQEASAQEGTRAGRTYVPDVDIYETADSMYLWADMPGVEEKSLNVRLDDGVLTIEGQVVLKEYEHLAPVYTEYKVGNYERRFTVSRDVDADKIAARLTNGVLALELPKAERAKPRQITINRS